MHFRSANPEECGVFGVGVGVFPDPGGWIWRKVWGMSEPAPEQKGEQKKRKGPPKGSPSPNPYGRGGKPKVVDPPDDGVVDAGRMRKVLGQDPAHDVGPTEKRLREWLLKDAKGYLAKVEALDGAEGRESALRSEVAGLRARVAELEERLRVRAEEKSLGVDAGAARAEALIEKILAETHS